ncbi:hypothetical protein C0991_003757 [Blastosporella zonata]|nr:hypothetical protein C0991_003757 [Blastosporella zonata]
MQHIHRKLEKEAENAVSVSSGLNVPISSAEAKKSKEKQLEWPDIGDSTMDCVRGIIKQHQPLTWQLVASIAARRPRKQDGVVVVRTRRPIEGVATNVISTLNFLHSQSASLLPIAVGLLYFGASASYDLFRYHSRLGGMPAYGTIIRAMRTLSDHEAEVTLAHGRSPSTVGIVRLDNVQNYHVQRDPGIGQANKLNIGLAAMYYEVEGVDVDVFSLASKRECLAQKKRHHLQTDNFLNLVNSDHLETVMSLQWLQVLVTHIPELDQYREHVSMLYRTHAAV